MQQDDRPQDSDVPSGGSSTAAATLDTDFGERIRRMVDDAAAGVVYQPVWDLARYQADGSGIVGFEVLARFDDGRPPAPPNVWFEEAARAGLEVDLELVVAGAALDTIAALPVDAYLSLNVSPVVAAAPRFRSFIESCPHNRLVLEVPENAPVDDYEKFASLMTGYRALGVRLAIDDVGAGISGLEHVVALDPDIIKIDLSITRGIDGDRFRRSLAESFVSLAQVMNAVALAEGIETAAELETLVDLGVGQGQGYLLAPPAPADHFRIERE